MNPISPLITVIIPTWNLKNDLIECVESIHRSTYNNIKIIVIDNNSTDGTTEYFSLNYPEIHLIKNTENLGYAAAINQGIKAASSHKSEYYFILNNDTLIFPETIKSLLHFFLVENDVGIVAPKVLYYENPNIIFSIGDKVVPILPIPIGIGYKKKDQKKYNKLFNLDFVTGCAMLISKNTVEKVGYFSEKYFMYYEDADFCYRTKKQDFKIYCDGNTTILHKASLSSKNIKEKIQKIRSKNRILYFGTHNHGFLGFITLFLIVIIDIFKILKIIVVKQDAKRGKAYFDGMIEGINTITKQNE